MALNIPSKPLKIAFTFDSRSSWLAQGFTPEQCAEFEKDETIDALANSLGKLGTVERVGGLKSLVKRLASSEVDWDLVFNISEGYGSLGREGQVPAVLEAWGIPFTFSDSATMGLCQDKAKTKMVLEHYKIPTAPFATIPARNSWPSSGFDPMSFISNSIHRDALQTYPLFIKPSSVSTGIGIGQTNKASSQEDLIRTIEEVSRQHPTAALLVEQFLPGREFTVGIIGSDAEAKVVGIREFVFLKDNPQYNIDSAIPYTNLDPILLDLDVYCHALKRDWSPNPQQIDMDLNDPIAQAAAEVALKAWRVLGCRDGGRIDLRHDTKDQSRAIPNFMEVNPIAGLIPDWSDLPLLAKANGITYDKLIGMIVESVLRRQSS